MKAWRPVCRHAVEGQAMFSRWLWWCAAGLLLIELGLRMAARYALNDGETFHVIGSVYLTNATNAKDVMIFGWSALTWLFIGTALILMFYVPFVLVGRMVSGMRTCASISIGISAVTFMLVVAVANIIEKVLIGGVTDYLAWIDLPSGSARVFNLGDVVLLSALAAMSLAYVWMIISVIRSSASSLHLSS